MEDTLTIVILLDGKSIYVNLEKGKVVGGSVNAGVFEHRSLIVTKEFDLCGYPYVELEPNDDSEGAGVLA